MTNAIWVGPVAVAALAAGWLGVQAAWGRVFPGRGTDGDVLSGRLGCHGCGECERECESGRSKTSGTTREGS